MLVTLSKRSCERELRGDLMKKPWMASPSYRSYVLILLMVTYIFSYMDRQILAILIEGIGAEFALSDTQRGLLLGFAFALFYAGLGIPVAWLADRSNRKNIIAAAIVLWSSATAICAMATGFGSLLAARMAVGVGEAGGTPPAHSILADYFRKAELTRALSVYSLGPIFGGVLGLGAGGLLADQFGWRTTLVIVGLPGILIGLLVYCTIREPERGRLASPPSLRMTSTPQTSGLRSLFSNKPFFGAVTAYSLQMIIGSVLVSWAATILIRSFDATKSEAGIMLGAGAVIGSVPGMLLGGLLTDRLGARNPQWKAWVPALALVATLPFYVTAMFAGSLFETVALVAMGGFFFALATAPGIGIVQSVVQPNERALASAILLLFANMFGLGLGPLAAGMLSDQLEPQYGAQSLNIALALISLVLVPAALAYLWTAKQLRGADDDAAPHTPNLSQTS